jgi:hypothetical protein
MMVGWRKCGIERGFVGGGGGCMESPPRFAANCLDEVRAAKAEVDIRFITNRPPLHLHQLVIFRKSNILCAWVRAYR